MASNLSIADNLEFDVVALVAMTLNYVYKAITTGSLAKIYQMSDNRLRTLHTSPKHTCEWTVTMQLLYLLSSINQLLCL